MFFIIIMCHVHFGSSECQMHNYCSCVHKMEENRPNPKAHAEHTQILLGPFL